MLTKKRIEEFVQREDVVKYWFTNTSIYSIRHVAEVNFPWTLDFENLDGQGGGGAPFKTRDEIETYLKRHKLEPKSYATRDWNLATRKGFEPEQLTLEI